MSYRTNGSLVKRETTRHSVFPYLPGKGLCVRGYSDTYFFYFFHESTQQSACIIRFNILSSTQGIIGSTPLGTHVCPIITVKCVSIGTSKNNKTSICSKSKIDYFWVSQNLGTLQPNYNELKYWNT